MKKKKKSRSPCSTYPCSVAVVNLLQVKNREDAHTRDLVCVINAILLCVRARIMGFSLR